MQVKIDDLIEISQYYGKNKAFVIAGGGNTSFKTKDKIWVKASGYALSDIKEDGFAMLNRQKLDAIATNQYSNDPFERERQIKDDLANACISHGKRPSVETSLHNLFSFQYVVHLHPTLVNGLMCSNQAEEKCRQLFGDDVLYVPYTDPGYILFKEVEKKVKQYKNRMGSEPKVTMLQNHGIFVASDSCDEIKTLYSHIINKLKTSLHDALTSNDLECKEDITTFLPALRMMITKDQAKTLKVRYNTLIEQFTRNEKQYKSISKPFTPDLIVYCKSNYIYIDHDGKPETILARLEESTKAFNEQHGYMPKVILIKNVGLIAVGDNAKQCETILDVFEDAIKISFYSMSFGGPHFMTPEQIQFIDTWEVENYRRKVSSAHFKQGRVENKTIIITGAAQGFGKGIAEGLAHEGANIVVVDINETTGNQAADELSRISGNSVSCFVKTNIAEEAEIKNLMYQTVKQYGGFDVFISNAGILRSGGLDDMETDVFDLVTKINYNAYFYCTKYASKILKLQNKYNNAYFSDIIQINSKSGLRGSKKNFAYAGGKFGGVGLTESFALELAPHKVKVNAICPGNYYEGPLWSDPENGLFVQYLKAGKVPGAKTVDDVKQHYLQQVPLQKGCVPADVVKAVLYLIDQENETGQALPISGGQVMLR